MLTLGKGEVEGSEGGDYSGFCTEDKVAERGFVEIGRAGCGEFGVGPATFRADREDRFLIARSRKNIPQQRSGVRGFGQEDAQARQRSGEGGFGLCERIEDR